MATSCIGGSVLYGSATVNTVNDWYYGQPQGASLATGSWLDPAVWYGQVTTAIPTVWDAPTGGWMPQQAGYTYHPPEYWYTSCSSINVCAPQPPTAEEQKRWKEEEKRRKAARARARRLLTSLLSRQQRRLFERRECFELEVNDRLYRVRLGRRVERVNKNTKKVESYFCIHPDLSRSLPAEDVAISQKLFLETNEKEFLRIANETKAA